MVLAYLVQYSSQLKPSFLQYALHARDVWWTMFRHNHRKIQLCLYISYAHGKCDCLQWCQLLTHFPTSVSETTILEVYIF